MLSNEFKEKVRDIGLLAERVICITECYDEPIEKLRKSIYYEPQFEEKENIIGEMIGLSNRIEEELMHLSIDGLQKLQTEHGIAIIDYTDMLSNSVRSEPFSNNDVKYKADAIVSIVLDIVHREIRDDDTYRKITEGELHENVQV